jgi:hypothetical protein
LLMDDANQRPKKQWWLDLRPIAKILSQTEPRSVISDNQAD